MKTDFDFPRLFAAKLKCDLINVERIAGGRNSQIFRVKDSKGNKFAAKIYYSHRGDARDRLGTEFNTLSFLWGNNIKNIPKPLVTDPKNGFAIYEYIDGCSPLSTEITFHDIDRACELLLELKKLITHVDTVNLPIASEAVFSINELSGNIKQRYDRLMAIPKKHEVELKCQNFLSKKVYPFYIHLLKWSQNKLLTAGIRVNTILPYPERTLSPSDFGFHNAVRRPDGKLVFLDFEYFGWDDPAKMIADFVLHPGMKLRFEAKQRFVDKMLEIFDSQGRLRVRLSAFLPLLGIKWCFILLNEFIPVDMARRDFSSITSDGHEKRKLKQLSKAKKMLNEVVTNYERFYNFN
jgi:hypothetical protein